MPFDPASAIVEIPGGVRLSIRAQPRSSREGMIGLLEDGEGGIALKVAVMAPPVEGEANLALIKLLAKLFGVAKRDVRVVSGESGRTKRIEVVGVDAASARSRIRLALKMP